MLYQLTSKIWPKRPKFRTLSFLMVSFQEKILEIHSLQLTKKSHLNSGPIKSYKCTVRTLPLNQIAFLSVAQYCRPFLSPTLLYTFPSGSHSFDTFIAGQQFLIWAGVAVVVALSKINDAVLGCLFYVQVSRLLRTKKFFRPTTFFLCVLGMILNGCLLVTLF